MSEEKKIECPKCKSTQIQPFKKGFSGGKAVAGAVLTGCIGLLAGTIGSNNIKLCCLSCGNEFKIGEDSVSIERKRAEQREKIEANKPFLNGCLWIFGVVFFIIFIVAIIPHNTNKTDAITTEKTLTSLPNENVYKYVSVSIDGYDKPQQKLKSYLTFSDNYTKLQIISKKFNGNLIEIERFAEWSAGGYMSKYKDENGTEIQVYNDNIYNELMLIYKDNGKLYEIFYSNHND